MKQVSIFKCTYVLLGERTFHLFIDISSFTGALVCPDRVRLVLWLPFLIRNLPAAVAVRGDQIRAHVLLGAEGGLRPDVRQTLVPCLMMAQFVGWVSDAV